ncbi:clavata3esr (cle)-related protein 13 [Nicotiana attenuata]|uniref:Clavata3esr (Cle)-related protein 13 n=1 Tax=Nicotiana attenuata TaxID=49451 RepID=A0A1J6IK83_NICAT|nr:clavata3esr (cle)-related protein 13 [Nicotiana attenuata]
MAPLSKNVSTLILSLALVLCFIVGWCNLISNSSIINHHFISFSSHGTLNSRRELIASKFDFKPFMRHHRKHLSPPPESGIDPIYGVEKRLVPSGPNPLHH